VHTADWTCIQLIQVSQVKYSFIVSFIIL